MFEQLTETYLPLIGWTLAGLLILPHLHPNIPRLMGRSLYWVGVPLQIWAFVERADLTLTVWLVPAVVSVYLLVGFGAAWFVSRRCQTEQRGGLFLSAILGNTGFVGLAITPHVIDQTYLAWAVLFSLSHTIIGSYILGVAIASYYGEHEMPVDWRYHCRSVLTTPSLWTFGLGVWLKLQHVTLPETCSHLLSASVEIVIPMALLLIGVRLQAIRSWEHLGLATPGVLIKLILLPLAVGIGVTLMGIVGMPRLAMVLEAGMPTAFAGIILAEEYQVNEELILMSIALSSVGILVTVPLWLWLFPSSHV